MIYLPGKSCLLVLYNAWSPSMYRNDRLAQNHRVLCTCPLESISIFALRKGGQLRNVSRYYCVLLFLTLYVQTSSTLWAQTNSSERIFFHAKIFTGDEQNPYAEAVAIRGDRIVAVGNLPEVAKSVSQNANRVDLEGNSLFPGFIDSHSHSIDGGLGLISADASEKVRSLDDLAPFVEDAKKTGKGMRGDILEILACHWSSGRIAKLSMPCSAPALTRSKASFCAGWMDIRRGRIGRCYNVQASRLIL